jgi:hypothetical protein
MEEQAGQGKEEKGRVAMEEKAGEAKEKKFIRRLKVLEPLPVRLSPVLQPHADPQHSLPGSVDEMSEIRTTDLLPLAESTSGISTAAGDASISSGMRHQFLRHQFLPVETGMHSKDNEHQGACMDQGKELPARETSGHASENHHQFLHTHKPHNRDTQGMLVSQGGNGIVKEMPIEDIQALKAHNLHDVDEVVLVCLRLCVGENCFFMSVCVIKSVHACWPINLPTNVRRHTRTHTV